jgi:hypothetical protein
MTPVAHWLQCEIHSRIENNPACLLVLNQNTDVNRADPELFRSRKNCHQK